MSEGQSFEQMPALRPLKPEKGPEVDIESVLEKGGIESIEKLKGYDDIAVVSIKDDGKGLFRYDVVEEEKAPHRDELELLAAKIDKILGFELVPPIVQRNIESQRGTLQQFMKDQGYETPASMRKGKDWREFIDDAELLKAAVFDFIINATDRDWRNFLINTTQRRIKLIDHDFYMMSNEKPMLRSVLVSETERRGLILSEGIKKSVESLLANLDSCVSSHAPTQVIKLVNEIRSRAERLITTGIFT